MLKIAIENKMRMMKIRGWSKIPKKFNTILKDIKNNGRTSKPISVKSFGINISLHPLIIKLLTAEKKGHKKY